MRCHGAAFDWPLGLIIPVQDPTPFSPFSPMDWPQSLEQARTAGYSVVELAITNPACFTPEALKDLVSQHKVKVAAFTTGQAAAKEGLSLSAPDEETRRKAIERLCAHARRAQELQAVVIIGLLQGKNGDLSLLHESLRECVQAYPRVRFALEPLNRYETSLINTISQAVVFVDQIGAENLGILFDTFHANIEERSFRDALEACGERLFHVHLADTNRWIPGFGHFPFSELWETLSRINYRGAVILECFPRPDATLLFPEAEVRRRVQGR